MAVQGQTVATGPLEVSHLGRPASDARFDTMMIALSGWFLGGSNLDGWAHTHGLADESFFTPWHAAFYTGFLAVAGYLVMAMVRHHREGYPWRRSLPDGYEMAALGMAIFGLGGLGDMLWHTFLGVEVNVEALLSPPHLMLAVGAMLLVSGPFVAAWRRAETRPLTLQEHLPMLISLTFIFSLLSGFTQFAHPLVDVFAGTDPRHGSPLLPNGEELARATTVAAAGLGPELGVASMLIQTALMVGVVLLALRRWALPPGSFTLVIGLNGTLMTVMHDQYRFIPAVILTGLLLDWLVLRTRPGVARPGALRRLAFALPVLFYSLYFATLWLTEGIGWSPHAWVGATLMSGVVGFLLSLLLIPPAIPAATPPP